MTNDSQLTAVNDNGELLYGYRHRCVKDFVIGENRKNIYLEKYFNMYNKFDVALFYGDESRNMILPYGIIR
jgi:hypothetical protein